MSLADDRRACSARVLKRAKEALREFDEQFPTKRDLVREMRRLKVNGDCCSSCNGIAIESRTNARRYYCPQCQRTGSYTLGTMFCRTRCLRAWLVAIKFFEANIHISAHQFAKLLMVASATAQAIYRKLGSLIDDELAQKTDLLELETSQFRGAIGLRSRLTPAHVKPANEPYLDEKNLHGRSQSPERTTEQNAHLFMVGELAKTLPCVQDVYDFIEERGQPNRADIRALPWLEACEIPYALHLLESNRLIMRVGLFRYAIYDRFFVDPTLPCICRTKKRPKLRIKLNSCSYHIRLVEVEALRRAELDKEPRVNESLKAASLRTGLAWLADWQIKLTSLVDDLESEGEEPEAVECKRKIVKKGLRYLDRLSRRHRKISRKYVQIYLSIVGWLIDRTQVKTDRLLSMCARTVSPPPDFFRMYNTPPRVRIQLPKLASLLN